MHNRRNTLSLLALAASVAVLPLLGCDTKSGQADRKVLEGVASTPPAYNPADAEKNANTFDALAKDADITPGRRSLAKAAQANAELDAAKMYLRDLQPIEVTIAGKLWEMEQLAAQMKKIKTQVDVARRRNPAEPLPQPFMNERSVSEALASKAAAARQGEGPWIKGDTASLANAAATKTKIDELQGQIDKIKANIADLTKQRDTSVADAGKAQMESESATGEASTAAYLKGAELRKQAAMLGVQIEAAEASLVPLTQDLAAAKAHEQQVTAAAESFDAAAKMQTEEYAKQQKNIEQMLASAKTLLDGEKESLKSKTTELNTLIAQAAELRDKAINQLKSAEAHYADAVKEAEAVKSATKREVKPDSPEAMLDKALIDAHEASALRLRQAEAAGALAATYSAHAAILTRRQNVNQFAASAATPLALSVPAEMTDPKIEDELKEARTNADDKYKAADEILANITDGATGPDSTRATARLARAVLNAGWGNLAAIAGDAEAARTRKDTARGFQKEVADAPTPGVTIPPYLMVITDTVPMGSALPTTAPATKPAAPVAPPVEAPKPPAGGPGIMDEK